MIPYCFSNNLNSMLSHVQTVLFPKGTVLFTVSERAKHGHWKNEHKEVTNFNEEPWQYFARWISDFFDWMESAINFKDKQGFNDRQEVKEGECKHNNCLGWVLPIQLLARNCHGLAHKHDQVAPLEIYEGFLIRFKHFKFFFIELWCIFVFVDSKLLGYEKHQVRVEMQLHHLDTLQWVF